MSAYPIMDEQTYNSEHSDKKRRVLGKLAIHNANVSENKNKWPKNSFIVLVNVQEKHSETMQKACK